MNNDASLTFVKNVQTVPMTKVESEFIRKRILVSIIPLLLLSVAILIFIATSFLSGSMEINVQNMLIVSVLVIIIIGSIQALLVVPDTKDIFVAKLKYHYRIKGLHLYFEDVAGHLVYVGERKKLPKLVMGNSYKVHKVNGKAVIIGLEDAA